MTKFDVKHLIKMRETDPTALDEKALRDYTAQIVHLANNTDLMDEEQAQAFPAKAIIKKLRDCHKSLIDRYNNEQNINSKLLLMHSATAIAHSSLIVEDDHLVKQNDHILDALFTSLGVYAADKVAADNTLTHEANVSDNAHVSEVSATLLITLVHEQTQTWSDPALTALVTNTVRKWLTDGKTPPLTLEEQTLRHRLLVDLFPEETIK